MAGQRACIDCLRRFPARFPQRAGDDSFAIDGWCAWNRVEGRHEEHGWLAIIAVGDLFHSALVGAPRPEFIARRTDPWAIGDRVA